MKIQTIIINKETEKMKDKVLKIKDTLPNTLHGLLKVALDDLEVVRGKKEYKVDMKEWYNESRKRGKCIVCLAGSVMARILKYKYTYRIILAPWNFKNSLDTKLYTIEEIRRFGLINAFSWTYIDGIYRILYSRMKRKTTIDKIYGKEIRIALENLEERFKAPGYSKIMRFTNFNKSMKAYRGLQKELEALGV